MSWRAKRLKSRGAAWNFKRSDGVVVSVERNVASRNDEGVWRPSFLTLWVFRDTNIVGFCYFFHDAVILHTANDPLASRTVKVNTSVLGHAEGLLESGDPRDLDGLLAVLAGLIEWKVAAAIQPPGEVEV